MKFFENITTAEQLKAAYKKLAKELHPDANPDKDTTSIFQELQQEYIKLWESVKNIHTNAKGETYRSTTETTEAPEEFFNIVSELMKMKNVLVELCGSWLWITGSTKEYKEELKKLGCKWSKQKNAWSFHHEEACSYRFYKHHMSLDAIRSMYGSVNVTATEKEAITA